ncbi:hypothetical protein GCM10020366_38700 [Saccharopolyspora gregorii]|uniref:Uncharacterized protein n=1 Tax=Saccharopolyspora gregorii TaxID=33914 RepID=A0ABP6RU35_9PSEU
MPVGDPLPGVTGVLQRRPGGFHEQPFLRVHVGGLAGGDAEERGVEAVEVVQERAPLAVAGAPLHGALRVGFVEAVQRPALDGDLADAVAPGAQVVPELIEGGGVRVAAGEADDRDGFGGIERAGGRRFGADRFGTGRLGADRFGAGRFGTGRFGAGRAGVGDRLLGRAVREPPPAPLRVPFGEVPGEVVQRRVLVEQGLRQRPEPAREAAVQPGHRQRVDAEGVQRRGRVELRRVQPHRRGDQFLQRGQHRRPQVSRSLRHVALLVDDQQLGCSDGQRLAQGAQRGAGRERVPEAGGERRQLLGGDAHPAVLPQRPADRGAGPGAGACGDELGAVRQVGVQETVRGGVVALPGVAERPGAGGERGEEVQRQVAGGVVEVNQPGDLRRQHPLRLLEGLADEVVVLDQPGGVQHAVEPAVRAHHVGDECGDGGAVGDVEAPVLAVRHLPRLGPPAQHQVRAGGVPGGVGGEQPAETARSPGDQVDAAGFPRHRRVRARHRFPVPHPASAAVVPDVLIGGSELGGQHPREFRPGGDPVELDELPAQPRVLLGRGVQQPDESGVPGRGARRAHHLHVARAARGEHPLELAEQPGGGVLEARGGTVRATVHLRHRHRGGPQRGGLGAGDVAEHDEPPGGDRFGAGPRRCVAPDRQAEDLSTHVGLRSGARWRGLVVRHR